MQVESLKPVRSVLLKALISAADTRIRGNWFQVMISILTCFASARALRPIKVRQNHPSPLSLHSSTVQLNVSRFDHTSL